MTKQRNLAEAFRSLSPEARTGNGEGQAEQSELETARPRRTLSVALAAIRVEDRLRLGLDEAKIETIAASMRDIGLQSPVLLRPWREADTTRPHAWGASDAGVFALVAGAHRLAAARVLGWTEIEAMIVDGTPDEVRLMEIDENLARAELTALDRARFLAARKAVYERLFPEACNGGDRKSIEFAEKNRMENISIRSFADDASAKMGLTSRAVRRAVAIGEGIDDEAAEALAGTALADREGDLHRLSKLSRARQRVVAGVCASMPGSATLDKALSAIDGKAASGRARSSEAAQLEALRRAWRKACPEARRRFRDEVCREA